MNVVSNDPEVCAALDKACQFKVGEIVALRGHLEIQNRIRASKKRKYIPAVQPLQVIERGMTQCYGGIQAFYICRALVVGALGEMAFGTELQRMMEVEVVPLPEEQEEEEGEGEGEGNADG